MERKKYALLALLVGAIIVLGVVYVGDNPDWTLPVSVRAQEIENLSVDIAAQTLDHVDINIKSQSAPVDINVTNSELDVNVTNSTLNVNVQGTANVEIQNAELNVQTLKEQASAAGNIEYADVQLDTYSTYGDTQTLYTNSGTSTVYLEMITARCSSGYNEQINFEIRLVDSSDVTQATFYAVLLQFPLKFDPAIPIPAGWKIKVSATRVGSTQVYTDVSALIRTS